MYTEFYHLKKCPFHITPDPEFLFLSPSHKQALGAIIYGVEEKKGFIAIVGEVGVG
jgi:general secretion pathway protein A